jgi:hypothetical protein
MTKTRKFYFLVGIFDIFNYICIARQFKNDFHYSNLHFGHSRESYYACDLRVITRNAAFSRVNFAVITRLKKSHRNKP